jgi:hypothetical protein
MCSRASRCRVRFVLSSAFLLLDAGNLVQQLQIVGLHLRGLGQRVPAALVVVRHAVDRRQSEQRLDRFAIVATPLFEIAH